MIINRIISKKIIELFNKFPILTITGPRQSGKTTLVKTLFPDFKYVNLEDPKLQDFALSDPKGFLNTYERPLIIDEAQKAPELFSYIQITSDNLNKNGLYILTGSQNFLLAERITQSLAGRVAIFYLLPFSLEELKKTHYFSEDLSKQIITGFYPRIYSSNLNPKEWYSFYTQTYLERDVRQIINVGDVNIFYRFLKLCASRCGQIVNFSNIGNEIGVSYHTIRKWLSVLEQSFIIFFLYPYFKNFKKRIIKSPKLYFYDSGLVCSLLDINDKEILNNHYLKGGIFESFVLSELLKHKNNNFTQQELYYWRDSSGNEVDCLITDGLNVKGLEIKSTETIKLEYFNGLNYWRELNHEAHKQLYLVYAGLDNQARTKYNVLSWNNITGIFND